MKKFVTHTGSTRLPVWFLVVSVVSMFMVGCTKTYQKTDLTENDPQLLSNASRAHDVDEHRVNNFRQVNLVDNNGEYHALHLDPLLLNAWGLAFSTGGIAWVSSEDGHVSTVYDKEGNTVRPPVNIPSPGGATGGTPTGVVFNGSATDFKLSNGLPARFIFVGSDGIISGWNSGNNALLVKNNSAHSGYTGVTIAAIGSNNFLYAANFKAGRIDVYDKNFSRVWIPFIDRYIPRGYAPFNIQQVEGLLFVTYAKVGADGEDETGPGKGFVDIYRSNGRLISRFASRGRLNAPWGVAKAPEGFFNMESHDKGRDDGEDYRSFNGRKEIRRQLPVILIGNFGDGRINAFNTAGEFLGQLRMDGKTIEIEGLWALSFPPKTATTIDPNRLYFTAGPDDEADGLFGYLVKK